MNEHKLKTWPRFFHAVKSGAKPFEIRRNDRDYKVGDVLTLEEFEPCRKCIGRGVIARQFRPLGNPPSICDCMKTDHPKGRYTGASFSRRVTYILDSEFGLMPGFCCMGLGPLSTP